MYYTPDTIPTLIKSRVLRIPFDTHIWSAVYSALLDLTRAGNWQPLGVVTPEEIAQAMMTMFDDTQDFGEVLVIGAIFPFVTTNPPPHCLECDGATYNRVDYPNLYALLDTVFVIDADTFITPDLRDRFVMGTAASVGDTGGEATVTLDVAAMPAHSHSSAPHSHADLGHVHAEGIAIPSIAAITIVTSVPSALPAIGATAIGNAALTADAAIIDNTGGGGSHNNLPPFVALRYCILAG